MSASMSPPPTIDRTPAQCVAVYGASPRLHERDCQSGYAADLLRHARVFVAQFLERAPDIVPVDCVRFHGRRVTKWARKSNPGASNRHILEDAPLAATQDEAVDRARLGGSDTLCRN